jgi:nitrite reductase (NADH) small subunit
MSAISASLHAVDLGPVEAIPLGEGRSCVVNGREIAVFRTREGEVLAVQARCPHRGGPLADGLVGGGSVVCPLHAYRFDLHSGRPMGRECPALITYTVEATSDGRLLLLLTPRSQAVA